MEAQTPISDAGPDAVRTPVLHHVAIKTIRMRQMTDWYVEVLGCRVIFEVPGVVLLSNDKANHRIALTHSPKFVDDPEQPSHPGVHHTAFEYGSIDDLLATWVRLAAKDITPYMSLDHHNTLSFYYRDPDGTSLELFGDWLGDWEASTRYLQTSPEVAANPFGTFVDPGKAAAARDSGMSLEELHRRGSAGEFLPVILPDLGV